MHARSARYACAMGLLFDSFWRAAAYCLRPRVMLLSVVPLLLMALLALVLQHFYWDAAVQGMASWLDDSTLLASMLSWLASWGLANVMDWLAPLMVVLLASPVLVVVSLLSVAFLMTPALVNMVAVRRFPSLERKQGGALLASISWSLASTVMALLALLFSVPLWLVPPLVLVLPPLIWGWLTYRVMAFDALAELATFGGLNGFMPYADTVVPAVKSRADPKPLADGAKPHAKIGMLKTLTQLGDSHNGDELGRSDSNALGYYDQDDVA